MNIKINGKKIITNCCTLHDLRKKHYDDSQNIITIFNGFQTFDDYDISENDEVNFIEKVKASKVAIAGLGGLGSNIAVNLARTGVGHLHLIDHQSVVLYIFLFMLLVAFHQQMLKKPLMQVQKVLVLCRD